MPYEKSCFQIVAWELRICSCGVCCFISSSCRPLWEPVRGSESPSCPFGIIRRRGVERLDRFAENEIVGEVGGDVAGFIEKRNEGRYGSLHLTTSYRGRWGG